MERLKQLYILDFWWNNNYSRVIYVIKNEREISNWISIQLKFKKPLLLMFHVYWFGSLGYYYFYSISWTLYTISSVRLYWYKSRTVRDMEMSWDLKKKIKSRRRRRLESL